MNVIIVGAGDTALQLAESLLARRGFEVTIIELDEDLAERIAKHLDALVISGDGAHPDILRKAKIGDADVVACLTGSDPINTVIAMLARQQEVDRIIVRLKDPALRAACEQAGATEIVMPKATAAAAIIDSIRGVHRIELTSGNLRLRQLPARLYAGTAVSEIDLPDGLLPVAILRDGDALLARRDLQIEANDEIILASEDDSATAQARVHFGVDEAE